MHGRVPDVTAPGRVLALEGLAAIKPRKRILLAVERRELEANVRMEAGVDDVVLLLAEAITRRWFLAERWCLVRCCLGPRRGGPLVESIVASASAAALPSH